MAHARSKDSDIYLAAPLTPGQTPSGWEMASNGLYPCVYASCNLPAPDETSESLETAQWSAAIGKANLGKSGRVIERLIGENDMLKRDLSIERLRAEESNQSAKVAEAKMGALESEYEELLREATVNKTLLKSRERQLADYKAQVESAKQRAAAAVESEHEWRDVTEKCKEECRQKVDEAQLHTGLMEGRIKVVTSHWSDQGAEVDRSVTKLGKKINSIVKERTKDDGKINLLYSLCEQQAEKLNQLELEKDGICEAFEAYKEQQEDALKRIKSKAAAQEKENEEILEESKRVLRELRWALGMATTQN
jgi:chromosome segregation ATPase